MAHLVQNAPRLSIGLPVYNGNRYLAGTLDCILAQTFEDFEIIISDNASTDQTEEICRSYAGHDSRIRYFRNERNLGAIPNFNRVFEHSRSPLFKWIAHDDLYDPRYCETCIRILDDDPEVVLAHSKTAFIDDRGAPFPIQPSTGRYIDPKTGVAHTPDDFMIADSSAPALRFWEVLSRAHWATHMFGIVRREKLQKTHLHRNFQSSDRAMLAELALLGRFRCANEILFSKRFHEDIGWAVSKKELVGWLGTEGGDYSRRLRQIGAYVSAPYGKPVGLFTKAACACIVAAHSFKAAADLVTGKEARKEAQGAAWRKKDPAAQEGVRLS